MITEYICNRSNKDIYHTIIFRVILGIIIFIIIQGLQLISMPTLIRIIVYTAMFIYLIYQILKCMGTIEYFHSLSVTYDDIESTLSVSKNNKISQKYNLKDLQYIDDNYLRFSKSNLIIPFERFNNTSEINDFILVLKNLAKYKNRSDFYVLNNTINH